MKKNIFLLAFFAILFSVSAIVAQDDGGGGRRGRRGGGDNGNDQGGGPGGMGGMGGRGMRGDMGGGMGGRGMGGDQGGRGMWQGGGMAPGGMAPGGMAPGGMAPGGMGPGAMGPGAMGPGAMAPGAMGPGGMGQGGAMTPEAMQAMRNQRTQSMLQNFDANRNGIIDPEEAQGQNAFMLDRVVRQAGIDQPQYPMPISKIQEAMNNRARGGTPGNGQAEKTAEEIKAASGPRLVPGFELATASKTPVLGFGVPAATDAKKTATDSSSEASSSLPETATTSDEKFRSIAKGWLKQNDENGNGKLEKEEWSKMKQVSRGLASADKNHDGVIDLDELTAWSMKDNQSGIKAGGAMASAGAAGGAKRIRARSATERLPEGLPDWFARKDSDGDGQVSMFEYNSGDWTEAKAKEFVQYDPNNDGIITPQEILKVTKKK